MTDKPRHASGYTTRDTERSQQTCLQLATVLGDLIERKDAYDLFYTLRNFDRGPASVALALAPLVEAPCAPRALDVIRQEFCSTDGPGPRRVASFLDADGGDDLLADVAGHCRELLRLVETAPSQEAAP